MLSRVSSWVPPVLSVAFRHRYLSLFLHEWIIDYDSCPLTDVLVAISHGIIDEEAMCVRTLGPRLIIFKPCLDLFLRIVKQYPSILSGLPTSVTMDERVLILSSELLDDLRRFGHILVLVCKAAK